jgi:hypothetical protein
MRLLSADQRASTGATLSRLPTWYGHLGVRSIPGAGICHFDAIVFRLTLPWFHVHQTRVA